VGKKKSDAGKALSSDRKPKKRKRKKGASAGTGSAIRVQTIDGLPAADHFTVGVPFRLSGVAVMPGGGDYRVRVELCIIDPDSGERDPAPVVSGIISGRRWDVAAVDPDGFEHEGDVLLCVSAVRASDPSAVLATTSRLVRCMLSADASGFDHDHH
jgi:hypothetical protein